MKHGFYSDALDADEQTDLATAEAMTGIDDEIALLRVKLKRAIKLQPDNAEILMHGLQSIARALVARHRLSGDAKRGLDDALSRLITELSNEIGYPPQ